MLFADNQNLIISRGVAGIFQRYAKAFTISDFLLKKKSDFFKGLLDIVMTDRVTLR